METANNPEPDFSFLNSKFNAHLTFNVLNTVQGFILENNSDAAIDIIGRYSKLLRSMLLTDQVGTSLKEELDIINDYLEIERIRMEKSFLYSVEVPWYMESQHVPKSFLVGIIENAVKHGIRPLQEMGYIKIDCPESKGHILRIRNNAPSISNSSGLGCGIDLTNRLLERYNAQTGSVIQLTLNRNALLLRNEIEFETLIRLSA